MIRRLCCQLLAISSIPTARLPLGRLSLGRLPLGSLLLASLLLATPGCSSKTPSDQQDASADQQGSDQQETDDGQASDEQKGDASPGEGQTAANGSTTAEEPSQRRSLPTTGDLTQLNLQPLTPEQLADGWISLFDGLTLFGWEAGSNAQWRVEDGTIVVEEGEKGLLCTHVDFADYILRVDFKAEASTNSGIFLRTPLNPKDPAADCYELNIAPEDNPFPTGSLVARQKTTGHHSDQWQSYEVTLLGGKITINLNGETIAEYTDETPITRGRIGLQLNEGRVAFRNIQLKPLSTESLFNGKTLDGWKTYPMYDGEFSVNDEGLLHVENGSGQLETAAAFGDFVLQLECRTNAPHLNSGIFFRCIPGEKMNGYESQIQNQVNEGPTDPFDCGTGGIFRRVNARIVAAQDLTWFHKTIVATGPRIGVWVNGVQVTAWTDERSPDPNPRRGLRVEPGTIMIQAHDPTTNLDFRNLRIAAY